jgi:hypothetical protein
MPKEFCKIGPGVWEKMDKQFIIRLKLSEIKGISQKRQIMELGTTLNKMVLSIFLV